MCPNHEKEKQEGTEAKSALEEKVRVLKGARNAGAELRDVQKALEASKSSGESTFNSLMSQLGAAQRQLQDEKMRASGGDKREEDLQEELQATSASLKSAQENYQRELELHADDSRRLREAEEVARALKVEKEK